MTGPIQEIQLSAGPGDWRLTRADPDADLAKMDWYVKGVQA